MDRLIAAGTLVRRAGFRGYMHLKIIPGASRDAIAQTLRLARTVSVNIETPGAACLSKLSHRKDYLNDIIGSMQIIAELIASGRLRIDGKIRPRNS